MTERDREHGSPASVTLRCLVCANTTEMSAALAERCFGPAPHGAHEADSDGCHLCGPKSGIYPSVWVDAAR